MKANELMTGDWVLIKRTPSYEYPYKICSINNYSILGEGYTDWIEVEADEEIKLEDIEPIPLTAEILEKNGWKYNELPFIQGWEQFGLLLYAGGEGYRINCGNNVAMRIDAVHELQHALRLCGIDKEIVL